MDRVIIYLQWLCHVPWAGKLCGLSSSRRRKCCAVRGSASYCKRQHNPWTAVNNTVTFHDSKIVWTAVKPTAMCANFLGPVAVALMSQFAPWSMVSNRDVSRRRWAFGGLRVGCHRKWAKYSKRQVDGSLYIVVNSQRWTFVTNNTKQCLIVSYDTSPQLPNAYFTALTRGRYCVTCPAPIMLIWPLHKTHSNPSVVLIPRINRSISDRKQAVFPTCDLVTAQHNAMITLQKLYSDISWHGWSDKR